MKTFWSHWNLYELVWLFLFCGIAVWVTIASGDNLFGFAVFLSGVLCVVLAAKGSIFNYPVGLFNTVGYAWLALQNGLFGEVGLYMLFFFPMSIIGFMMWRKHMDEGIVVMKKLSLKAVSVLFLLCAAAIAGLGFGLSFLNGQNTPYADASATVLSIAATLLMIRRYREQWIAYIVLNILSIIIWVIRMTSGSPDGPLMIVMWSAYLINSIYGMYNWTKGSKKDKEIWQHERNGKEIM